MDHLRFSTTKITLDSGHSTGSSHDNSWERPGMPLKRSSALEENCSKGLRSLVRALERGRPVSAISMGRSAS